MSQDVSFAENTPVFSARERSPYFYLLLSGKCLRPSERSGARSRIQSSGPGDAFVGRAFLNHDDTMFEVRPRGRARTGD